MDRRYKLDATNTVIVDQLTNQIVDVLVNHSDFNEFNEILTYTKLLNVDFSLYNVELYDFVDHCQFKLWTMQGLDRRQYNYD